MPGEQGLSPRIAGPRPGAQGLPGPQGLRIVWAIWNAVSAACTGVGAGAVAAIAAAAIVDRLPASRADFRLLVCIRCSFSTGSQAYDFDVLDDLAALAAVHLLGSQRTATGALYP